VSAYDCIIVGAGHNGLVCAFELARTGRKVLVLERRDVVGGCAVTEEPWPGYRVSTAAYVVSLLLPDVERRMRLAHHGYRVLPRNPSSFTPTEDGRYLLLGADAELNRNEISKFSTRDAEAWPRFNALLERIADALEPILRETPPDVLPLPRTWRQVPLSKRLRDARAGYGFYRALKKLGTQMPEAIELLSGAARPILDRWFESDVLKATLATDAIIGTFQPISAPGTAYVLLHHVMGSSGGARGVWGYVEGGMGGLTQAMAEACREAGVEIRTGAEVTSIRVSGGKATGVTVAGQTLDAAIVASGVDCNVTFGRLVGSDHLPGPFVEAVRRIDYASASMKINLALRELPDFTCMPGHAEPGPQHRGTIHIGCTLDLLERAYDDAKYGRPSEQPVIEMTIPSSVDPTLAPPRHHVASLFVQYAPYRLANGDWDDVKDAFTERGIDAIARFAPNIRNAVLRYQAVSPKDLERTFGLTGGNIFQGAMALHQLFALRPVPGWSDYRTPVKGLYLCGSAAHPGGGVTGACGLNAAREILRDDPRPATR